MDAVTMRCRQILLACCAGLLPVCLPASEASTEEHSISEHIVRHREVLEVIASAEISVPIHNPLRWPQVRDAIPDGAFVEEGAVLVRFDETGPAHELARTRLISNTAEAELARDTADIDNSQIDLRDRRDANRDQVAVLEARRQRILAIPDPATLVFKGVIPEASRRFFAEGDPATLLIVGFKDVEVAATVVSISSMARDTADRESVGWGTNVEYGVKVHDIVLRPLVIEDWMRVGAHAHAIVTASQPTVTPAVPLPFVRIREGRPHLVHAGRAHPVTGTVSGNLLILDDTAWLGRTVSLQGSSRMPQPGDPNDENSGNTLEILYTTSGELVPAATTPVVVGRTHRMQKITWLIPEDSVVTQGMAVARLDDKETLDDILEWESRLTSATSEREAQEQNSAIREREQAYQLAVAANLTLTAPCSGTVRYNRVWSNNAFSRPRPSGGRPPRLRGPPRRRDDVQRGGPLREPRRGRCASWNVSHGRIPSFQLS